MNLSLKARLAGLAYLVTFVTGIGQLVAGNAHQVQLGSTLGLVATAAYVVVTALFYDLFRPVNRDLSLVAAFFSLVGCAVGTSAYLVALVFFGFYCVLIGSLIWRSGFLPRVLGVGMLVAGLCWLTNLWPPLASGLSPYILAPGALGEGALMLWLLVKGVDGRRWSALAAARQPSIAG